MANDQVLHHLRIVLELLSKWVDPFFLPIQKLPFVVIFNAITHSKY
jgi:hypothetical protein